MFVVEIGYVNESETFYREVETLEEAIELLRRNSGWFGDITDNSGEVVAVAMSPGHNRYEQMLEAVEEGRAVENDGVFRWLVKGSD